MAFVCDVLLMTFCSFLQEASGIWADTLRTIYEQSEHTEQYSATFEYIDYN